MRRGAVGNYRLTGATLCVTIEPCLMCVGALVHARIATLVYGAAEPKTGAIVSTVRGAELPGQTIGSRSSAACAKRECRELMQAFFRERRATPRPVVSRAVSDGAEVVRLPGAAPCAV